MDSVLNWFLQFIQSDAFVLLIGSTVILGAFEFFFGVKREKIGHWFRNVGFGVLYAVLGALLAPTISYLMTTAVQALGGGWIDLRAIGFGGIAGDLTAIAVSTLIFDFFFYWLHRFEHMNQFLWQQHVVHHSDRLMAASTGALSSPAEVILIPFFVGLPMAVLFKMPAVNVAVLSTLPLAWLFVQHANFNLSFGPLWWLLVSPNFHRIHHSVEKKHFDKNFALWYPVWDIIFKTAYRPSKNEIPETGVVGVEIESITEAFLYPLKAWFKKS